MLSVCRCTRHGRLSASRPLIAAISSMRLLVVSGSPPDSSRSVSPMRSNTPQPPGPGLPRHAPSVNISTAGNSLTSGDELARQLEDHALGRMIGLLLANVEAGAQRVDYLADQYLGSRRSGGDPDRVWLTEPIPVDVGGAFDQARRHAQPLGDLAEPERVAA